MKIPFISGEAPEGFYPINLFFLPEKFNGRNELRGTPGLINAFSVAGKSEVRDMIVMGSYLYVVMDNTFYICTGSATLTAASTTLDTSSGPVSMVHDGTYIMIVDGAAGYTVTVSGTTPTLTKISDTDFPQPGTVTYQDGYFIVNKVDTGEFYISALDDPTSWAALDFAEAEGAPDNALACLMDHRELFIFGTRSVEVFYNSGDSDFPFERIQGSFMEIGLGAAATLAKMDNSVFWLADDLTVRRANGYVPQMISPPRLNQILAGYTTTSDAIGFPYSHLGNVFYILTFPTEDKTWVYNAATNFWHQWSSGIREGRHRSNCYAWWNGVHYVGDYANGTIYSLDDDTYTDDGSIIKWKRTAPPILSEDRNNLFFHELNIEFKVGVGLVTGQGNDPQVMLRWSDDEARTWSNEHWTGMGKIGEYTHRAIWRRMGTARSRIYEVSGTDPVERSMIGASARIGVGTH